MSETAETALVARLPRGTPLTLLAAGRRAFAEVPGLRALMIKGALLLYAVSILVGLIGVGGVYLLVVQPLTEGMAAWSAGEGFWASLLTGIVTFVVWIAQLLLLAATVAVSFLVALAMMSVWFEALAARIAAHHRGTGGEGAPFRLRAWLGGIGRSLLDAVWLIGLAVAGLALGFIPVIGVVLVVVIESYLLGREVRDPYLVVREGLGDDPKDLRKGLVLWTPFVGLLPFVLAMIPVVGWVLLPAAVIYLVAGFAWRGEAALAAAKSSPA